MSNGNPESAIGNTQGVPATTEPPPPFSALGAEGWETLRQRLPERRLSAGETLFEEGDDAVWCALILEGEVRLQRGRRAGTVALGAARAGEMLGLRGYFEGGPRLFSARAVSDLQLIQFDFRDLPDLCREYPDLEVALLRYWAQSGGRRLRSLLASAERSERSLALLTDLIDFNDPWSLGGGVEGLIKRVVQIASKTLGADRATLFLVDEDSGDLWSVVAQGMGSQRIVVPAGQGLAGWCLEHGETIVIQDAYSDPRFNPANDKRTGYRTQNMLCGPVFDTDGKPVGVIQVLNKADGDFDDDDLELFTTLTHQAAVAVRSLQLIDHVDITDRRLGAILDLLGAVTEARGLGRLAEVIVERVAQVLECDRATLYVVDQEAGAVWSVVATGANVGQIRLSGHGIADYVAGHGELVNSADPYSNPHFNPEIDRATGYRTRSLLSVPVRSRAGEVCGVLQALNKGGGGRFRDGDEKVATAIAERLGDLVVKILTDSQLQTANRKLAEEKQALEREVDIKTTDLVNAYQELREKNVALRDTNDELNDVNNRLKGVMGVVSSVVEKPIEEINRAGEDIRRELESGPGGVDPARAEKLVQIAERLRSVAERIAGACGVLRSGEAAGRSPSPRGRRGTRPPTPEA